MAVRLLMKVRLDEIRDEGEDVKSLYFVPLDRKVFPSWGPGDHVLFRLERGVTRQYSLCQPPSDPRYRVAVRRAANGRGGSLRAHAATVGEEYFLSYPQPDFPLDIDAQSFCLIAGGIGITPILSFLHALPARRSAVRVLYFVRTDGSVPFLTELEQFGVDLVVHNASRDGRAALTDLLEPIDRRTAIYCCGGDGFVTAVRTISQQLCFQNVHFEAFAGGVSTGRKGESFVADLPRSKHVLQVPEDKTLLEVLLSDGVDIDYACEAGVCRSCIVDVLEGDVIHHDQCLTDEERKTLMTPCVSRARGRLVINSL